MGCLIGGYAALSIQRDAVIGYHRAGLRGPRHVVIAHPLHAHRHAQSARQQHRRADGRMLEALRSTSSKGVSEEDAISRC